MKFKIKIGYSGKWNFGDISGRKQRQKWMENLRKYYTFNTKYSKNEKAEQGEFSPKKD